MGSRVLEDDYAQGLAVSVQKLAEKLLLVAPGSSIPPLDHTPPCCLHSSVALQRCPHTPHALLQAACVACLCCCAVQSAGRRAVLKKGTAVCCAGRGHLSDCSGGELGDDQVQKAESLGAESRRGCCQPLQEWLERGSASQ